MKMCYDGALVMPSNYVVMSEDEMMYVDGGFNPVPAVQVIIATMGLTYGAGRVAGERLYHGGITTKKKWAKYKWPVRAAVVGVGQGGGVIFMMGLENKLYSMMK